MRLGIAIGPVGMEGAVAHGTDGPLLELERSPSQSGAPEAGDLPGGTTPPAMMFSAGLTDSGQESAAGSPDDTALSIRELLSGTSPGKESAPHTTADDVEALVCAVPDSWLHQNAAGARGREWLRRLCRDDLALPSPVFTGTTMAAAASVAHGHGLGHRSPVTLLVCQVGARNVSAALYTVDGAEIRLTGIETATGSCGDRPVWNDRRLAAVTGPLRRALAEQRHRAALVLPRARTLARYRATPVYDLGPATAGNGTGRPSWLTAGQVLDHHAPFETEVRDTVRRLLRRTLAEAPDGLKTAVVGELGSFPPTLDAVKEEIIEQTGRPAAIVPAPHRAAGRGAALIATGAVRVSEPARYVLDLPVHAITGGVLRSWNVPLPSAGVPGGSGGDAGAPPVEVPSGSVPEIFYHDPRTGASGVLRCRTGPVPPGRYTLVHWPNRRDPGAIALRPAGGGETLTYGLTAPGAPVAEEDRQWT